MPVLLWCPCCCGAVTAAYTVAVTSVLLLILVLGTGSFTVVATECCGDAVLECEEGHEVLQQLPAQFEHLARAKGLEGALQIMLAVVSNADNVT